MRSVTTESDFTMDYLSVVEEVEVVLLELEVVEVDDEVEVAV